MKMTDLDENLDLSEAAPMGFFNKLGNKIVSYVPGDTGAIAKGRIDSGEKANKLRKLFPRYIGQLGLSMKDATGEILLSFLRKAGLPTQNIQSEISQIGALNVTLEPREINKFILMAVQDVKGRSSFTNIQSPSTSVQNQIAATSSLSQLPHQQQVKVNKIINAIGNLTPQQQAQLKSQLGNIP